MFKAKKKGSEFMEIRETKERLRNKVKSEAQGQIEDNREYTLKDVICEVKHTQLMVEDLYALTVNGYSEEDAARGFKMAIEAGRVWDISRRYWWLLAGAMIGFSILVSAFSLDLIELAKWGFDKVF